MGAFVLLQETREEINVPATPNAVRQGKQDVVSEAYPIPEERMEVE